MIAISGLWTSIVSFVQAALSATATFFTATMAKLGLSGMAASVASGAVAVKTAIVAHPIVASISAVVGSWIAVVMGWFGSLSFGHSLAIPFVGKYFFWFVVKASFIAATLWGLGAGTVLYLVYRLIKAKRPEWLRKFSFRRLFGKEVPV